MSCPPSPSQIKTFRSASTCHCARPSWPVGGTGTRYQHLRSAGGRMSAQPLGSLCSLLLVYPPLDDTSHRRLAVTMRAAAVACRGLRDWLSMAEAKTTTPERQGLQPCEMACPSRQEF